MENLSTIKQTPLVSKIKSRIILGSIYLGLAVFCWSGGNIIYKFWSESLPPYLILFFRYILASLLLGIIWIQGKGYKEPLDRKTVLTLVVLGLVGIAFHNLSLFFGVKYTSATMGAIILATAPIIAQFLAVPALKHRISTEVIGWSVVSLIGVVIVVGVGWETPNWEGLLWLFGSTLTLAFFNVYAVKLMQESSITPKTLTFVTISVAMIPFFPLIFLDPWDITVLNTVPIIASFWFSIIYLVVVGNVIGRSLYNIGVQKAGSSIATVFINFGPIFTGILAFIFLNEIPTIGMLIGSVFVIIGVMGIVKAEDREHRKE